MELLNGVKVNEKRCVNCLCDSIRRLSEHFNESDALAIAPSLNKHLGTIRKLLNSSKALSRDVSWQLTPTNQRTRKILSVNSVNVLPMEDLYSQYQNDVVGFWDKVDVSATHAEIRRRVACVAISLRSELDNRVESWLSPGISRAVVAKQGNAKVSELRFAGKKYIKMARKLGGAGALMWLPFDVPASTYERYLIMDDEEVFTHLQNLGSGVANYDTFIHELLKSQVYDQSLPMPYHNLFPEFGDLLPSLDQIFFVLATLGGENIPLKLLKSVRTVQKRWMSDGELRDMSPNELDIPLQVRNILSDDVRLQEAETSPMVVRQVLEDGSVTLSLTEEGQQRFLLANISSSVSKAVSTLGLRLICHSCPPCYEGNTNWSPSYKRTVWTLFDKCLQGKPPPTSLLTHLIEALLFLSERELFKIRVEAIKRARDLLQPSMPYYYHASVALFESNILRVGGELDNSDAVIQHFLSQSYPQNSGCSPVADSTISRCDNALRGRLHISHVENKIRRYDKDVESCMYDWEGLLPLSTFEIEVTRRLQGTAARYFQSVGDFTSARASLQQHLWLNTAKPIRPNTRALIVGKLSETHCELNEFTEARDLLVAEIASIPPTGKRTRPFRRLSLALVEANLGLGQFEEAETMLRQLAELEPPELDDINDQYIHMRRLVDEARLVHERKEFDRALQLWRNVLERMDQLSIFKTTHKWTAVVIWLSIAHLQCQIGDDEGMAESWGFAAEMARTEKCEYAIPNLSTLWLKKVVGEVHLKTGWPFRIMVTGGMPDLTWS